jgi:hypothetical protein
MQTKIDRKSSSKIAAIPSREPALLPLVPDPTPARGARKWIDNGTPDNSATEYPNHQEE